MNALWQWVQAHPDQVINTILFVWGVLIARGYVTDKRLVRLYDDAVAFAQQWKRVTVQAGGNPAPEEIKQKAINYLMDRGIVDVSLSKIEAAVGKLKAAAPITGPPARGADGKLQKAGGK